MTDHPHEVVFGDCGIDDPDHQHVIVDHHPQHDLVFDSKCPACRCDLEDGGWCPVCSAQRHEHYELMPPTPEKTLPCPVCGTSIERLLVCTMRTGFMVMPCEHECLPDSLFPQP